MLWRTRKARGGSSGSGHGLHGRGGAAGQTTGGGRWRARAAATDARDGGGGDGTNERKTKLQPAVVQLDDALDIGSVGSGQPISTACRVALREREAPKGRAGYLGIGPQFWAGYRRQAGTGARGKRAAEWRASDADARAQVRQRVSDGGGRSSDMIL